MRDLATDFHGRADIAPTRDLANCQHIAAAEGYIFSRISIAYRSQRNLQPLCRAAGCSIARQVRRVTVSTTFQAPRSTNEILYMHIGRIGIVTGFRNFTSDLDRAGIHLISVLVDEEAITRLQ